MADGQRAEFGDLLRRHRLLAGLSQQALAERAGLSVDAIAALERGRRRHPRAFTVRVLADALALDESARQLLVTSGNGPVGDRLNARTAVPGPLTDSVGRAAEQDAVVGLLRTGAARLVTLTGPGGVGKTHLALTVVKAAAAGFSDGVAWVPLSVLDDPAAITSAVASAFEVRETPGEPLLGSLVRHLADRDALLLLDNCEHVVAAAALLVEQLLSQTTKLRILATSRERLRLTAEVVRPVKPLGVPAGSTAVELATSPAVTLFVRRAQQLDPEFTLGATEAPAVASICRELDGLPLAIEMAAARTNVLSVEQITEGIDSSTAGTPLGGTGSRHRSLQAVIDWSYQLLAPEERRALRQLAVFAGGWTLSAATAACPVVTSERHALALTTSLVDKSLAVPGGGRGRYYLLFTVRRFAQDLLHESGEHHVVAAGHARWVAELAERAEPDLYGPQQVSWLDRLDDEVNNIRAALAWTSRHDHDLALRLAGSLWRYCYLRGRYTEGRSWLAEALEDTEAKPPAHAKARLGAGALAFLQCDYALAAQHIQAALDEFRVVDDHRGIAEALQRLGSVARERGEYDRATELHQESLTRWRALGDERRVAESQNYLGFIAWLTEDSTAVERCRDALAVHRRLADAEATAWALLNLGASTAYRGDLAAAEPLLRESLALSDRARFAEGVAWSLNLLGLLTRRRGDADRARELLTESLGQHLQLGDRWRAASVDEELAATVTAGDPVLAARLLGAAAALRGQDARRPPVETADYERTVADCSYALGPTAYAAQFTVGETTPAADLLAQLAQLSAAGSSK